MAQELVRGGIKLPCSSPRNSKSSFAKLLSRVDPEATHGFGFEGTLWRPGATLTDAEIRPGPEYPEIPIVLEYTPGPVYGIPGRRRRDSIYILWRYERDCDAWSELARAASVAWEWAIDLRPIAVRALREAHGTAIAVVDELPAVSRRIATFLDLEMQRLEQRDRQRLLAVLHDEFASRFCL